LCLMREYEELLRRLLRVIGEERRGEVEDEVERRIAEDPRLTRLGALYIVAGELGFFEKAERSPSIVPLAKLVGGLASVNIEARVLGVWKPRRGPRRAYLRLGDSSGLVDAVAWGGAVSRLEEHGIEAGGCIYVRGAYTRERADGSVVVHMGDYAEFSPASGDLPPFESFFRDLPAVFAARGDIDFKAALMGLSGTRRVQARGAEAYVRDVLLGWRGVKAELTLWGEHSELLDEDAAGRVVYVAGARWRASTIAATSRTCITLSEDESAQAPLVLRVERELGGRGLLLASSDEGFVRVYSRELEPGQGIKVKRLRYVKLDRAWVLIPHEYELVESMQEAKPNLPLVRDLMPGMVDVCVEGEVSSLSPATRVETRKGEVDFLSFWLRDGSGGIYCKAWGGVVKQLEEVSEGDHIALLFVRVVRNPWGERELYVGEDSVVLPRRRSP